VTTALPPWPDTPASGSALLTFDGRVLEVFGFTDAARYHVWEEPRLDFGSGRRPRRFTITTRNGRRHTLFYDAEHLPGLRALGGHLAGQGRGEAEPAP
jgi:hypothetical protein